MATLQESMDLQAIEQLRTQILVDKHLVDGLSSGLKDIELRENRAKQVLELTTDRPADASERRSATTALEKAGRQRSVLEERIRNAKYRIELAQKRLATFDHPALDRVTKIRDLSRIVGIAG
ncbi:MAG: hypothetical protein ABSD76_06410 [Terriglobales bacterium]|jgi:hypothetical protein